MRTGLFLPRPTLDEIITTLADCIARINNNNDPASLSEEICRLLTALETAEGLNSGQTAWLRNIVTHLIVSATLQHYSFNYFQNYFDRHVENRGYNIPHPYLGDLATFGNEAYAQWIGHDPQGLMGANITLELIASNELPPNTVWLPRRR